MGSHSRSRQRASIQYQLRTFKSSLKMKIEKMSDKTENKAETPAPNEEIKIGLSVKASLNVQKVNLVILGFLVGLSFSFFFYGFNHSDKMWRFLAANIFLPMFLVSIINLACVLYSIYAWTRTSIRYVYVDVFYLTTLSKLVNIFYCVYMLVIVFSPHHIVTHAEGRDEGIVVVRELIKETDIIIII